jgi:D-alanyl-D-alanine carboxypeptidase/D-alanyl-D-alanine-endopeptidase (penicillin-binding protein 4)
MVLALALGPALRLTQASPKAATIDLDALIGREIPPGYAISLQMADVGDGRILIEKNPDLALTPASTMKVVTSAVALRALGPDFTFVTEALVGDLRGDSAGSLYLRGGGDPYLVNEQLFKLVGELKDQGLAEIRDRIVVDDSFFSPEKPLDEQEPLGPRAYHAPYSALSLNFNSMKVLVRPGPRPGTAAVPSFDPVSEYASLVNGVKTVAGAAPPKLTIEKEQAKTGREVVKISGTIGVKSPVKGRYVNVSSPGLYLGEVFKEFLLREGVKVQGNVVRGRTPSNAISYVKFQSPPLGLLVYWLNKFSNNFMAEQINLGMGAFLCGAPGTREKGLSVIRSNLDELGVKRECYAAAEASGLSRANKLSASALVRVLLASWGDFTYGPEFIASLGVAGTDGTLKEKFTDPSMKGRIRAKTGNLRGVNALAGFASLKDGGTVAFAVIVNSLKEGAGFIDYGERVIRAALEIMDARVERR